MRRVYAFVPLVVLVAIVGACRSRRDDGAELRDAAPLLDAASAPPCEALAAGWCALVARCDPERFDDDYATVGQCRASLIATCTLRRRLLAAAFDEAHIATCAQALTRAECSAVGDDLIPVECLSRGVVGEGGPCVDDGECASGACGFRHGHACGKCATVSGGVGAPCRGPNGGCARGLHCAVDFTCAAALPTGASCRLDRDCEGDLVCVAGACATPLERDAPCERDFLHADAPPALDAALLAPRACRRKVGDRCARGHCAPWDRTTADRRCSGGVWRDGVCVARIAIGAACDGRDPLLSDLTAPLAVPCVVGANCIDDRCALPTGDECGDR